MRCSPYSLAEAAFLELNLLWKSSRYAKRERSQKGERKKYGKIVILQKRKKEYFFLYLDVKDIRPSGSH